MTRLIAFFTCLLIAGCGGHGFEGTYRVAYKSENPFVNATLSVADSLNGHDIKHATITDTSLEINGKRQVWNEIGVEDQDGERYLVFKKADKEKRFQIIDHNTLSAKEGLFTLTLNRVYN